MAAPGWIARRLLMLLSGAMLDGMSSANANEPENFRSKVSEGPSFLSGCSEAPGLGWKRSRE
jgi:hypothetical protein